MPGDARGVGRRVGGAVAGPYRGHPAFGRLGPAPAPAAPAAGCFPEARRGDVGGVTRVPGSAPRGSSAGLGSPTGHPKPASPACSGRELSTWLLPPPRHQERLPAVPADPQPPSLPGCLHVPSSALDCEMVLPGGCPEDLGLRVESNQHGSEVPGSGTYSCGMGDIASPLEGLQRALAISLAPLLPSA